MGLACNLGLLLCHQRVQINNLTVVFVDVGPAYQFPALLILTSLRRHPSSFDYQNLNYFNQFT